jgi:hypothetical protein
MLHTNGLHKYTLQDVQRSVCTTELWKTVLACHKLRMSHMSNRADLPHTNQTPIAITLLHSGHVLPYPCSGQTSATRFKEL